MAKPFLKWVGGKTQLLSQFEEFLPSKSKIKKYYEPFIGGGALFFYLEPDTAIINDLNSHLINLYKHIRDDLGELVVELEEIENHYLPLSHEERKSYYYEVRSIYNQIGNDSVTRSALLIFLNKTGYNGMYRENPQGEYNIPFGRNNISKVFDLNILEEASLLLKRATLLSGSYEIALKDADRDDFIYLDPPYVPLNNTTSNFTKYIGEDFTMHQHADLKRKFDDLNERGCKVMLSNSDTELVREMYREYKLTSVYANRFINCKPGGRGKITELVITNY